MGIIEQTCTLDCYVLNYTVNKLTSVLILATMSWMASNDTPAIGR